MKLDHVAMGLGLAVLAFVGYQAVTRSAGNSAGVALAGTSTPVTNPNGGALWQNLTLPLGARGPNGAQVLGSFDQVYSSASWNPDALSAAMQTDGNQALIGAGISTANQWGFTMPTGS